MNKHLLAPILILFCLATIPAWSQSAAPTPPKEQLQWYTSLDEANKLSKANKKPIFAFFTGSDWCGWCTRLQRDVFAKPEFIAWAKKSVILLELDFPRRKQLPTELAQQNAGMQQALNVTGYPTVWLLYINKDETKNSINLNTLGSLGYPSGAVPGQEQDKFLTEANKILAQASQNTKK